MSSRNFTLEVVFRLSFGEPVETIVAMDNLNVMKKEIGPKIQDKLGKRDRGRPRTIWLKEP